MDHGRLQMEDGRWTTDDGRWTMEDGRRKMEDGRYTFCAKHWNLFMAKFDVFDDLSSDSDNVSSKSVRKATTSTKKQSQYSFGGTRLKIYREETALKKSGPVQTCANLGDLENAERRACSHHQRRRYRRDRASGSTYP